MTNDDKIDAPKLGERIRKARERLGISQEELAKRIERDQRGVSLYESGQRKIFAVDLPRIAQALEVPISYFFDESLSDTEAKVLSEFQQLPSKQAQEDALLILQILRRAHQS
jgi:transcriptional regulator with XRE-family HTH domain